MPKSIGGRGKTAPYKTVMVRVPEPIKGRVEELKNLYHSGCLESHDKLIAENQQIANKYREELSNKTVQNECYKNQYDKDELITLARKVLKQKKSARETIIKLYTALLGDEITAEDLK
ncbi:hypothetical protein Riv7116_6946 (plasmid) [Rivularia sp. PCC 7116]|uniref:hypothetical protein n=1 Tax=Rivularia sp. PCC 7116 TaxID=373994 RepID=UPI00029EC590|nr:hypothetical protein [Rivularia sp. PCC 7116]AFY59257.1 hypothetical protein Riv7116_6946 [Rivularia sp. PCC 7116]